MRPVFPFNRFFAGAVVLCLLATFTACRYPRNWELQTGEEDYARLTLNAPRSSHLRVEVPQHPLVEVPAHGKNDYVVGYMTDTPRFQAKNPQYAGAIRIADPENAITTIQPRTAGNALPNDLYEEGPLVSPATAAARVLAPPRILLGGDAETYQVHYPGFPWPIRAFRNELSVLADNNQWVCIWDRDDTPAPGAQLEKISVRRFHRRVALETFSQSHVVMLPGKTRRMKADGVKDLDPLLLEELEPGDTVAFVKNRRTGYLIGPFPSVILALWTPYTKGVEESLGLAAEKEEAVRLAKATAQERKARETRVTDKSAGREISFKSRVELCPFPSESNLSLASTAVLDPFGSTILTLLNSSAAMQPFPTDRSTALTSTADIGLMKSSVECESPLFFRRWSDSSRLLQDDAVRVFTEVRFRERAERSYDEILLLDAIPQALVVANARPAPTEILEKEDGTTILVWRAPARRGLRVSYDVSLKPWMGPLAGETTGQ